MDKILEILKVLSNPERLIIFELCKDGIPDITTPEKVNMTRKQYYEALKALKRRGLIMKYDDIYKYTTLGSHVYYLIDLLRRLLKNTTRYKMADALKKSGEFTEQEINDAI